MLDKEFERLVLNSLKTLPSEFLQKLENVSVVIEDYPSSEQNLKLAKRGSRGGLILGLYEGVPQTKRGRYGIGGVLPDKITIFKIPILMISKTLKEVKKVVKDTVIHEIAHHYGLSDEDGQVPCKLDV